MTCYNPITKSEIFSSTIVFIPHTSPIPTVTIANFLQQAASNTIKIVTQQTPLPTNTYQLGNHTRNGLFQLAILLKSYRIINEKLQHLQTKLDKIHITTSP